MVPIFVNDPICEMCGEEYEERFDSNYPSDSFCLSCLGKQKDKVEEDKEEFDRELLEWIENEKQGKNECPFGEEKNPISGRCIKKCTKFEERNEKGKCVIKCNEFQERNKKDY